MSTTAPAATTVTGKPLMVVRRTAWLVNALFWSTFAVLEAVNHGWLAGLFAVAFFLAPDFTFLAGIGETRPMEKGQLPPRAVPFYNAAHRALVPLALMAAYTVLPVHWAPLFAGFCGWLAHISYDRAFGCGLRTKEGFQRA
ncbi:MULTISPECIES: DUF4260 family protein [unclassified Streptomyces]|uniref:DUF4260 family protein n=1 Tax=unclassified Streptomyces TaxID=2593676 RepID=UPI002E1760DF|nr:MULTISPECIES: DUF4260 family protein [unclassified Streptomyces]